MCSPAVLPANTTVSSGGTEIVFAGGTGSGITIASGGTEIVSASGEQIGLTVSAGGTAIVAGLVDLLSGNTTTGLTALSGPSSRLTPARWPAASPSAKGSPRS